MVTEKNLSRPPLAARLKSIPPFRVMDIVEKANRMELSGNDVIRLEVGEPNFATPELVTLAAKEALDLSYTRYTDSRGIRPLREAISCFLSQRHRCEIKPERIQITQGSSAALFLAFSACLESNDVVLMSDPGYPCNSRFVEAAGGIVKRLNTDIRNRFHPTQRQVSEAFEEQFNKALLLAHPANPTGYCLPKELLKILINDCKAKQSHLIIDEIYSDLVFEDYVSSLFLGCDHWVIGSFSKNFNMSGWRLGWLIMPDWAVEKTNRLAQHLFICPSSISQYAALACFESKTLHSLELNRLELKKRRDFFVPALSELGFETHGLPDGAFYVFADASKFTNDSKLFCEKVLSEAKVSLTPGIDFSNSLPPTWIRFAFTQPIFRLNEALIRLRKFLNANL